MFYFIIVPSNTGYIYIIYLVIHINYKIDIFTCMFIVF